MSEHDLWTEQAASYVLGALDEPERSAFEAHLEGCERCRESVGAYAQAAQGIALSAPRVVPPSALRERVLAAARAARAPTQARGSGRLPEWLAVAAVIGTLLFGGLWLVERAARARLERDLMTTTSELEATRASAADASARLADLDALMTALLAPDVRAATLTSEGRPPSARLYWSPGQRQIVLAAFDLPPAPAGRTYQLWGLRGGRAFSLGTFDTGADGRAREVFLVPQGELIDVGAVTEEPAGGSPQPTTRPFLAGNIPAL